MYIAYLVHQAERPRTAVERKGEAVRTGELAMALSGVLRGRGRRRALGAGVPASPVPPALKLVRETVPSPAGPASVPCQGDCRAAC